jgi:hypothetical protein
MLTPESKLRIISISTHQDLLQSLRCSIESPRVSQSMRASLRNSKSRELVKIRMIFSGKLVKFTVLRTLLSAIWRNLRLLEATQWPFKDSLTLQTMLQSQTAQDHSRQPSNISKTICLSTESPLISSETASRCSHPIERSFCLFLST